MTLSRRRLLQATALGPLAVWLPRIPGAAGAEPNPTQPGTAVPPTGTVVDAGARGGILGIGLNWDGPGPGGVVATVSPKVDGMWRTAIEVESDYGHGPPDPTGRIHGPAVLVPGATEFRITPRRGVDNLRHVEIPDTPGPLRPASADGGGLTTVEPISGLAIIERSNWTDRGRRATVDCWLGSSVDGLGCRADVGIRHAVVHHTVNINTYGPEDVARMLRGIQSYHMDTRGWDDIGYNFVIDRFGRIWHARAGTIEGSVSGAHTAGLNTESVGVAVLGTFAHHDPNQQILDAISTLLGWKLGRYGVDPLGATLVRSAGGDYAEPGEMIVVNNISGHRENQRTSCPGSRLFSRVPDVRSAAAELVPVYGHLVPAYGPDAVGIAGWTIDRFTPTRPVTLEVVIDQVPSATIVADAPRPGLSDQYPDAGDLHGFDHSVPIDLDTRSIVATVTAGDGRTAMLLDLRLFATFIDVEPTRYFAEGVYWLRANELTLGTQPGLFEPVDEVTRIQMAAFLWRLFDRPQPAAPPPFIDVPADHELAPAVAWLFETGITNGTSADTYSPDAPVTRGQMAAFIWRMCGKATPTRPSPFKDVASSVFSTAAAWLFETGITNGTSADTYSPDAPVTRGQMATFLHRLAVSPQAWTTVEPPPVVAATLASA